MNELENAYRQMYRGMTEKNRELLGDVLSDSFTLTHMTGMRQSKEAFMRAVEDGTLNYYSTSHQQFQQEVHGDMAEFTGQSIVSAAVFGGERHTWRLRLDCKARKYGGNWKIIEARASTW